MTNMENEEWVTGNPGRYARLAVLHKAEVREIRREECPEP